MSTIPTPHGADDIHSQETPEEEVAHHVPPGAAAVQRRTLTVLVLMQVIGTVGVGIAPSIGVLLAGQVTENETWAGLARTASTLGAAMLSIPLGALAARRGRRIALASGWWIAAVGAAILVGVAQFSLVVPLFLGLLLIGAGSAVSLQARFAATDLADTHHQARALAIVVWVGTLGSVIGPNLGVPGRTVGSLLGLNLFAGAFLIAAVCLAAAGLLVYLLLRPDPLLLLQQRTQGEVTVKTGAKSFRLGEVIAQMRSQPVIRVAVLAVVTAQVVMVALMTMTPVHMEHHGGSIEIIGLTISLHVAGMYALSPLVGVMADRTGFRPTLVLGVVVLLASLLIATVRPHSTGWIIASLILLGVGWCFVNVAGSALFSASLPDHALASAQGGLDAFSNLSGATAAFLSGPFLAASGFPMLAILSGTIMVPLILVLLRPLPAPCPEPADC